MDTFQEEILLKGIRDHLSEGPDAVAKIAVATKALLGLSVVQTVANKLQRPLCVSDPGEHTGVLVADIGVGLMGEPLQRATHHALGQRKRSWIRTVE